MSGIAELEDKGLGLPTPTLLGESLRALPAKIINMEKLKLSISTQ